MAKQARRRKGPRETAGRGAPPLPPPPPPPYHGLQGLHGLHGAHGARSLSFDHRRLVALAFNIAFVVAAVAVAVAVTKSRAGGPPPAPPASPASQTSPAPAASSTAPGLSSTPAPVDGPAPTPGEWDRRVMNSRYVLLAFLAAVGLAALGLAIRHRKSMTASARAYFAALRDAGGRIAILVFLLVLPILLEAGGFGLDTVNNVIYIVTALVLLWAFSNWWSLRRQVGKPGPEHNLIFVVPGVLLLLASVTAKRLEAVEAAATLNICLVIYIMCTLLMYATLPSDEDYKNNAAIKEMSYYEWVKYKLGYLEEGRMDQLKKYGVLSSEEKEEVDAEKREAWDELWNKHGMGAYLKAWYNQQDPAAALEGLDKAEQALTTEEDELAKFLEDKGWQAQWLYWWYYTTGKMTLAQIKKVFEEVPDV